MGLIGKFVLGSAIGFGGLALPNSAQAQNKPDNIQEKALTDRQKELEKARKAIHRETEDVKELIEHMRRQGVPEAYLGKIAKVFSEDFAKRLTDLEKIEGQGKTPEWLGTAAGILVFLIVLGLLLRSHPKNTKQSQDKKNFLEEEIDNIDWAKPFDVDKALEALIKFRDKQELSQNPEIKEALANIISATEQLKQIQSKGNLTIGDKPLLVEMSFKVDDALNKLWKLLKLNSDPENEITLEEWKEILSTGIMVKK